MGVYTFIPGRAEAWGLWAGADHYSLVEAFRRAPFALPLDQIARIYRVESPPWPGFPRVSRYALEYRSKERECFVLLGELPAELRSAALDTLSVTAAFSRILSHVRREPTVFLLPLALPLAFFLAMALFGLWNEYVVRSPELNTFLARPGCTATCVRKVLSIHSLVALLFLLQSLMLFLPMALLFFHAPRYRSTVNYRMIQSYSLASVIFSAVIFAQLLAFFPFRQYGKFVELGFDPKVERALNALKAKK